MDLEKCTLRHVHTGAWGKGERRGREEGERGEREGGKREKEEGEREREVMERQREVIRTEPRSIHTTLDAKSRVQQQSAFGCTSC